MIALPLLSWLNAPAWLPLINALLHTLWQGALVAGGLFLALRHVPAHRASLRYGLSAAALVLVVFTGVGSWALLDTPRHSPMNAVRHDHPSTTAIKHLPEELAFRTSAGLLVPAEGHSATQRIGVNSIASSTNAFRAKTWVRWLAACWLLGVSVSLLRAVKGLLGAGSLSSRSRDLTDPRVLALAEELCTRLGLLRRVRFLVSDEIGVPSMLGILYPAVLLPASLLTGVSLEQLRAILAHELAHIRRWDYLVNLGQILVEALLFFNPFIWWINRQMRLEREACCDQLAAGECQSPACYVKALVAVIERGQPAASPLLAASGSNSDGGYALERARRLLVPGYQPTLRLHWFSLAAILVFSGLVVSGIWLGTRAVAETVKMTEQKPASKPADDQSTATRTYAPYHIKVVMADGSPLNEGKVVVYNHDQLLNMGGGGSFDARPDGSATVGVQANTLTFCVAAAKEGLATVFAGPFTPSTMNRLEGLKLELAPGYAAAIQTVDETGQPVANTLLAGIYSGPPGVKFGELKTDAFGVTTLEHLGEAPLTVTARADGYQIDEIKNVRLDAAKPYRWVLKKTLPMHGKVTASATGRPIANATIRLAYVRGTADENYLWPGSGPVWATTDAQGGFTLGSLRPDCRYWFDVDAPGYGGAYVGVVTLAQGELNVSLGPERMIHGKVIHVPPSALHDGKLFLYYNESFSLDQSHEGVASKSVELTPINGEAEFTIRSFYKATGQDAATNGTVEWARTGVTLQVYPLPQIPVNFDDLPASGFILDFAEHGPGTSGNSVAEPGGNTYPRASGTAALPTPSPTGTVAKLSNDVFAAAREGNANQALSLLEASVKPRKFGEEDAARVLDEVVGARELRAFTPLHDSRHFFVKDWKLNDQLLAGFVKDGRTDFLDALIDRRFDLNRLTKVAGLANPMTAEWITHCVADVTKQQADVAALC